MSIFVRFIWKCDFCGIEMHHEYETSVYSDEMTGDNRGWTSDIYVPEEHRNIPTDDICDACPECAKNPNWEKYERKMKIKARLQ
jgi:hypothetical protein